MSPTPRLQTHDNDAPRRPSRALFSAASTVALAASALVLTAPLEEAGAQQQRPQVRQPVQQQRPVVRVPVQRAPVARTPVVRTPVARVPRNVPSTTRQSAPPIVRQPPVVRNTPPIVRNAPPVVTRQQVPRIPRDAGVPSRTRNIPAGTTTTTRPIPGVPGTGNRPGNVPPIANVPRPGTIPPVTNVPRPGQTIPTIPGQRPGGTVPVNPGGNQAGGTRPGPTIPTIPGQRPGGGTIPITPGGNQAGGTRPGGLPPIIPIPVPGSQRPGGPLAGGLNPGSGGVITPRPFPGQRIPLPGQSIPGGRPGTVFVPAGTVIPKLPRPTDIVAQRFIGSGGIIKPIRPAIPLPAVRPVAYRPYPSIIGHRWSERPRLPLYFASALIITGAVVATTYRPWHRPVPTCYVGGGVFYRYPGSDTCFDFSSATPGDYFETGGKVYRWYPERYETAEHCIEEQTTQQEVVTYSDWKVKTPAPEVERVRVVAARAAEKPPITLASPIARDRYDCSSCLSAIGPVRGEDGQCTATIVNNCTHTVVTIGGFTKGENQAFCDFASELEPGQEVAACAQPCENFDEARAYMNIALPPEGYTGDVSQCRVIETAAQTPAPAAGAQTPAPKQ